MTKREIAAQLRADTDTHYNCCQSMLVPFAGECGLDPDTAFRLGAFFGSGMRMGSARGVLTGGLMVLGMAGAGEDKALQYREAFRTEHGAVDCAVLVRRAAGEDGLTDKPRCDSMVLTAVELLERLLDADS